MSAVDFHVTPRRDPVLKRPMDVACALAGLIVLSPAWLPAALAVKLTSPGPVLHRASRVGRGGRPFTLVKFRSMRIDAVGPAVTGADDPRITRVGRVLRRYKIDELPQLINVLLGQMSMVGPRPEDARYVRRYRRHELEVLSVRPGITGAAAVAYRDEESVLQGAVDIDAVYVSTVLPAKLALELEYLSKRSMIVDLRLLVATVIAIVPRPGS